VLRVLLHALAVLLFINRFVSGLLLQLVRGKRFDETIDDYVPTVTVVIPLYNEGAAVVETLASVFASDYPAHKLRVICVDDASPDDSFARASEVARHDRRLTVLRNPTNVGKRSSINHAVRVATSEVIVSVDSDVVVDRAAIRELVRRFTSPRIAAVGGWVDVRNKHDNWLTRMQVVKYWYAYYVMKNIERAFRRVMSVSGCLAAYRRSVLVELAPILESRAILGVPIKYGEDRFLTRQIVKAGYLTTVTLDARCRTFVPATLRAYFSQQLRWRRSNVVDYSGGTTHVWRLNPLLAINYFAAAVVLVLYPIGIYKALAAHKFILAVLVHLTILTLYGCYYRFRVRAWPAHDRVNAFSYMPHALVMPITSGLLMVVALFTLDSSSWETRGHVAAVSSGDAERDGDREQGRVREGSARARRR
jgi:cellulose synthase/poly-beta-1,6-N-acetylglucosamine synthase-like glycosyltransferase